MTRRRLVVAAVVAGAVVAAVLVFRDAGPLGGLGETVALADATPAVLDTVALRGRRVEASLNGTVVEVGDDGRAVLAVGGGTVPVRFDGPAAVAVEDRVLAVGRLRGRWGGRYVAVEAWAVVRASARPPAADGL